VKIVNSQLNFTEEHLKLDGLSIAQSPTYNASPKALKFLQWFLAPMTPQQFFDQYWEKRVFILKRKAWPALKKAEAEPKVRGLSGPFTVLTF